MSAYAWILVAAMGAVGSLLRFRLDALFCFTFEYFRFNKPLRMKDHKKNTLSFG